MAEPHHAQSRLDGATRPDAPSDPAATPRADAGARTLLLSTALIAIAAAGLLAFDLLQPLSDDPLLAWWAILPIAVLAQVLSLIHI